MEYFCEICNFVGNTYAQYNGHLSFCYTIKKRKNDREKNEIIVENSENVIYNNEQNVREETYSDTGNYENDLKFNEDDFENNHQNIRDEDHQSEYLNFQKTLIDNSIIDHLQTGRIKLIDGTYSNTASINNYLEISNFGKNI